MFAQRAVQQSMRRLAITNPHTISRTTALSKLPLLSASSLTSDIQHRSAATEAISTTSANDLLIQQRLKRPVSPHLTIYRPQITWYLSGLNRITGTVLSGGLYIFATAYLAAPLFGWHLESASIAAAVATWPVLLKLGLKFVAALPFTFHSLNGVRHLVWDTGRELSNKAVQRTGWAVVGGTVVGSGVLVYLGM